MQNSIPVLRAVVVIRIGLNASFSKQTKLVGLNYM